MSSERATRRALLILVLGGLVLVALVFRPLGLGLLLGAMLAGALWPLERRLSRLLRGRSRLAAGLITLAVVLLILGPLVSLSAFIVKQAADTTRYISEAIERGGAAGKRARRPGGGGGGEGPPRSAGGLPAPLPS
jgi:predicted PurR-regulated permease PerM